MSRWRQAVAAVVCLTAWAACREDTGIIVELDALKAVRPHLQDIVVQAWTQGESAGEVIDETVTMRGDEPADQPLARLGLRPADPGKNRVIAISAVGRVRDPAAAGSGPVSAEASVTVHRGAVRRVVLLLGAFCGGPCPTDHVCDAAGRCVPAGGGFGPSVPPVDAGPRDARSDGARSDASVDPGRPPTRDAGPDGPRYPDAPGASDGGRAAPDGPPPAPPAPAPAPPTPPPTPPPAPPPGKLELGLPCQSNDLCASGFCIEGVCCDQACDGICLSCATAVTGAQAGLCAPVSDGLDPDENCLPDPAPSCGNDGLCDGRGACRKHPAGTACGPALCDANTFIPAAACNGQGACDPPQPVPCDLHRCTDAGCLRPCTADDQCTDGAYCENANCRPKKRTGETCTENRECLYNRCVGLADLKLCVAL
jgi:hypothetical protein